MAQPVMGGPWQRGRSLSSISALALFLLLLFLTLTFTTHVLGDVPIDVDSPVPPPEGCTAIAVTLSASTHGPMTTHTNDCKDCDFRLSHVPASTHPPSSLRPIPPSRFSYPRYVGLDKGHTLLPSSLDPSSPPFLPTSPIGHLPQPSTTYAYLDGSYAIQNSHGVSIGESTCAARLVSSPVYDNGSALLDVSELTRLALERSRTALEAVESIGALAERYGYYGAEWTGDYARGEAGEGLTITDRTEAWVFHILPDDTGRGAVWAAQRVPDGHVAVISNAFIIQQVNVSDTRNFRASHNLHSVARKLGWWSPEEGELNFARVYGSKVSFEVYCSRRTWRVFTLVAPSLAASLHPSMGVLELPFSVPVDRRLSPEDLFTIQRDHYENTTFDLTQGPASGPYGNPNRYDRGEASGLPMYVLMQGTFERPISMFRTSYSFVTVSGRGDREHKVWFAPAAPHASVYSPLWVAGGEVPEEYGVGAGSLYAWKDGSAWWASTAVGGWMERMWRHIAPVVRRRQHRLERAQVKAVATLESQLAGVGDEGVVRGELRRWQRAAAANATGEWTRLFYELITTFHDGYHVDVEVETMDPTALFYPLEWLRDVGFWGKRGREPDWAHKTWSYTEDYTPGLEGGGGGEGTVGWGGVPGEVGKGVIGDMGWVKMVMVYGLVLGLGVLVGGFIGRWYTLGERRAMYEAI